MYLASLDRKKIAAKLERIESKDPSLFAEFSGKEVKKHFSFIGPFPQVIAVEGPAVDASATLDMQERQSESIAMAHLRPVLIIRDNKVVGEFSGPDVAIWKERILECSMVLNRIIPSIGRIEIGNNAIYKWGGTGWLVDSDIIVTNRHVANLFCKNKEGFAFKIGFPSGTQTANVDFLEEYQRSASLEFQIESVLWMSENDTGQPDVAFMRVSQSQGGPALPPPIPLATQIEEDEMVVTIGYPARDPDIPDQELVLRTFGDVYDKKRLAPGQITKVDEQELRHDCSTLGGNSGSPVIRLATGEAVGLHFAGLYMKANFAVPATKVRELLEQLRAGTLPGIRKNENYQTINTMKNQQGINPNPIPGSITLEASIPIKITLSLGEGIFQIPAAQSAPAIETKLDLPAAVALARSVIGNLPEVISVESGYRFKRGWITDEEVIVVNVQQKLDYPALKAAGKSLLPQEFGGFGVDIRTSGLDEQLIYLGLDVPNPEAPAKAGLYREPPQLKLERITDEEMRAIFCVSPDSGWPNLKAFLSRVKSNLTATIYEWEAEHISKAVYEATKSGSLKMVTQRAGTKVSVREMKTKLGERFTHVWASVGAGKLIPSAYHIKVASRDAEEFWLSSGNWKNSNQAEIDPAGTGSTAIGPLRENNREWHVIIENSRLAKLFEDYIEWDFSEAQRVPLKEATIAEEIMLFVPELAISPQQELFGLGKYFKPLEINRKLDIQPLLTPDRNAQGNRLFIEEATQLLESAQHAISIENQSFIIREDNEEQYERFFNVLRRKQKQQIDIRIIFRDPREFPGNGVQKLEDQLCALKKFGLNTDNMKTQVGCHTKAIIIDPETPNGAVLFGSHNFTPSGALYNRDASLIVRDSEVARYFQQIFDFDWEVLARQQVSEYPGGIRIAKPGEETPPGFRKISLSELKMQS